MNWLIVTLDALCIAPFLCQCYLLHVPTLSKKFIINEWEFNDVFPNGSNLPSFEVEVGLLIVVW